jgi:protein phosphatase
MSSEASLDFYHPLAQKPFRVLIYPLEENYFGHGSFGLTRKMIPDTIPPISQELKLPQLSLVVLIGISGSGKSTWARKNFLPTEIVSSDACRAMVSDDENNQSVTPEAFRLLHFIVEERLRLGRLTVVDATNVQKESRQPLIALARKYHALPIAIVLKISERICLDRNQQRRDRTIPPYVLRQQGMHLRRSLGSLKEEGFAKVHIFDNVEALDNIKIKRVPLWCDRRNDTGPFDIVGDVHGCRDELETLLNQLGYRRDEKNIYFHPAGAGRRIIFLGDLVDRGPDSIGVLQLAMDMIEAGRAFWLPGNHDDKFYRYLKGNPVKISHGLAETIHQLEAITESEREALVERYMRHYRHLVDHLVIDGGKLVVAHAGMKAEMQGRTGGRVRNFALYGETTGETDEFGLPVRLNWAAEYHGKALVAYGHTPTPEAEFFNNAINLDQGCVFGGKLSALRYPEREVISVPALQTYYQPAKPFLPEPEKAKPEEALAEGLLDLEDVIDKRVIETKLMGRLTIRAEHAAAALEVMSRFAVDPRLLIYLPPTMSPCETSKEPGYLEYPTESFGYYRHAGVPRVVCEEKHMGSRGILILCRDEAVCERRFGFKRLGVCYTRTGRPFFEPESFEKQILERLVNSLSRAGIWEKWQTDWLALDCEILPWNLKAQGLLAEQYLPAAEAGQAALAATQAVIEQGIGRGINAETLNLATLRDQVAASQEAIARYRKTIAGYLWEVAEIDKIAMAPFHLLATEGKTYFDRDHLWHLETLSALAEADALFRRTQYRVVDVLDEQAMREATEWWKELTEAGAEGMVVKPFAVVVRDKRGLVQPALKCRGRDYLRIIYGPDYLREENLARLRQRGLGRKRSLALREFALGVESLERFVRRESLRRVHECVFGILALESEPVDPRL